MTAPAPICAQGDPFKRLDVEFHFHKLTSRRALISWAMNENFRAVGPWKFLVQRGRAVNETKWTDVASVVDQPWAWDNNILVGQMEFSTFYRVIMEDGRGKKYTSQPVNMTQSWDQYDWARMRKVLYGEQRLLKMGGTMGWLLKKRIWGERCPLCTDPNTGSVVKPNCLNCYGTGIVGGYYPSLAFPVVDDPSKRMTRLTTNQGLVTDVPTTVRALAWAAPESDDVWVSSGTQSRYRIMGDIENKASWRGVNMVLGVRLELLPISSITYQIPVINPPLPAPGYAPRNMGQCPPVAPPPCPEPEEP